MGLGFGFELGEKEVEVLNKIREFEKFDGGWICENGEVVEEWNVICMRNVLIRK